VELRCLEWTLYMSLDELEQAELNYAYTSKNESIY